jgi:hypothetical protein
MDEDVDDLEDPPSQINKHNFGNEEPITKKFVSKDNSLK